jgi:YidC/Oxa1 family membrane protein insertase
MDNQRLITWGLFAFLAFMTWQAWMQDYAPRPEKPAEVIATEQRAPDAEDTDALGDLAVEPGDLPAVGANPGHVADAATQANDQAQAPVINVRTDVFLLRINTRGGIISHAEMLEYPVEKDRPDDKVVLLDNGTANTGQIRSWLRASEAPESAPGVDAVYLADATDYALGDAEELVVPFTWTGPDGIVVEKRYVFRRGEYAIRMEQVVHNGGEEVWRGDPVTQLVRRFFEQERSYFDVDSYSFDGPQIYTGEKAEKLDRDELLEDGPETFTSESGWVAAIQHHFLSAIVPLGDSPSVYQVKADEGRLVASVVGTPATVAPGESARFEQILFVGPKLQDQLEAIHPKLDLTVDYGWLTLLSSPMFALLSWIHDFVGTWGWAIIIVTVIIKLAFYKLTATSGRSMAKMRELQPRMKALQERYKDDRQALSQAMMDLYKREKVNPAAGCLPILIQMPFFLAFYWVLVESVEMRQAPFALWIDDLSVRDPYFILPLIMGAAMLFQQKLNPAPADPVQARVMQIMPIMFTGFFAFFPSGLVLYWVTNTLLSIAQQWRINKVVHAEAVARKQGKPKKGKKGKPEEANPDPP